MKLPKIAGKLVYIRQLQKSDFEDWKKATESAEFRKLCCIQKKPTKEENKKKFTELIEQKSGLNFAIIRKEDKTYIGDCKLHSIDDKDKNAKLAIGLIEKYFGQGYGTDATKCLLKFGFKNLKLHRISLRVLECNTRAIATYKKCGFKKEGVMRDNGLINGKYYDDILMSILETEFEN